MIKHEGAAFFSVQRFRQKHIDVEHLDAFAAHGGGKHIMILLGLLDPENVVKQQFLAVGRREASVGKTGAADNDLPQFSGFGVDAKFRIRVHLIAPMFEGSKGADSTGPHQVPGNNRRDYDADADQGFNAREGFLAAC
ncbi:hypothetical protein GCM10007920_34390 [Ciceribacter naphthalenivorans]|uniref:Uncharacterized protein n=2 Tax=Alphaproteobacteria TaxID=28211 RepID=A0A512HMF5_9HYPH|nr:hypothetical protein RNA01_35550 [Ciceribacter naphthalenivorans]GLR23647.1 hypothetical protein GCM10007920_34390 [Ciceribacter naphthalenivorans]GLT06503.1 hypothetical protein GCM10007926_34390 [Sphingomonas psychrolutea]